MAKRLLPAVVLRLLRPLVRILLRHGIPFAAFDDLARRAYVAEAADAARIAGRKQTISRMAVLTGLSRKEVSRVRALPPVDEDDAAGRYHRAAKVITGWRRDAAYRDGRGEPAILPVVGEAPSFASLVKTYGADVPHRAMLDELERVGAVALEDDRVRLLVPAYIPRRDQEQKLQILGSDVAGLIDTIDHNLRAEDDEALRFQRKVHYDNLPAEALPELRALAARHGQELLELLDRWLAQHDRDASPDVGGTGRHAAGVGVYYFESDPIVEGAS